MGFIANFLGHPYTAKYLLCAPVINGGGSALLRGTTLSEMLLAAARDNHQSILNIHTALPMQLNETPLRKKACCILDTACFGGVAQTSNHPNTPVIVMSERLKQRDERAWEMALLHEVGHVVNNDSVFGPLVMGAVGGVAAAVTMMMAKKMNVGWKANLALSFLPSCIAHLGSHTYFSYAEPRADLFALKYATSEQLLGGERFFAAMVGLSQALVGDYPWSFTSDGKSRIPDSHGEWSDRLKILQNEIAKRSFEAPDIDTEKLYALVQLFAEQMPLTVSESCLQEAKEAALDAIIEGKQPKDRSTRSSRAIDNAYSGAKFGALVLGSTYLLKKAGASHNESALVLSAAAAALYCLRSSTFREVAMNRVRCWIAKSRTQEGAQAGAKWSVTGLVGIAGFHLFLEKASRTLGYEPKWPLSVEEYSTVPAFQELPKPTVLSPLQSTTLIASLIAFGAVVGALDNSLPAEKDSSTQ